MSYPRDLDEYSDRELRAELKRRRDLRAEGRCDYCSRPWDAPLCRQAERHQAAKGGARG